MESVTASFEPKNPDFDARVRDSFSRQPFMAYIGASIEVVEPGYVEVHLRYSKDLTQQHGFIHGGVLATIADNAAGYAAFTLMAADASVLTVEYKLNILRPGQGEKMVAKAKVIKPGRNLTIVDSDVYALRDNEEVMCVTSIQTLMALPGREDR
jgi:uncharacterized protein (TIGR00369 family)